MIKKEVIATRTVFVAECSCGFRDTRIENPPREIQCPDCKQWVKFKGQSWKGQDKWK